MVDMELAPLGSVTLCIRVYGCPGSFNNVTHTFHDSDQLYKLNVKVLLRHSGVVGQG